MGDDGMKSGFPYLAWALAAAMVSSPSMGGDLAMFRGNLAHTGVYNSTGISNSAKVKWTFHTAGAIWSSPAIADGMVYVGSNDGNLYAVDAATGAQKWLFKTAARIPSSPAVWNGAVFFASYDDTFYAVDAKTGALKWKFANGGERRFAGKHLHGALPKSETMPDPYDFYLSSPAIAGGMVYFGSGDGNVYALDAANGSLKWKFATGDVVHSSPAIAGGTLYIGSWDSYLYALDTTTGKEKWRFKTGEDPEFHNQIGIQSSPAVADGTVYFGCRDSNIYAVDAATGKQRWAFNNKGSWVIVSPAVRGGVIYAATSDTGQFLALDAKTGRQIYALDLKRWPIFSSPAIAGNMAYAGSFQGKLFAVDLTARRIAWTFETDASKTIGPAVMRPDGTLDFAALNGGMFYDDFVGAVARFEGFGAILSSPAVDGGVVYVGSSDGNLYALQ
jgi:eukaryotic-like serine/threonine-protein kinase